jgi:uncharacterized protein (DUF433 family)
MTKERRRERHCPSCGGKRVVRGTRIDGWAIAVPLKRGEEHPVSLTPFADVCPDCGMITLFVRIGDAR